MNTSNLASGNSPLDTLLHGILRKLYIRGIFTVQSRYRLLTEDLHGDIPLVPHFSGPTIAGHAFDHVVSSYFTGNAFPQTVSRPVGARFIRFYTLFISSNSK